MSQNSNAVIALDIGSSRTHIAAVDAEKLSCANRFDFDNANFDAVFPQAINALIETHGHICKINITSCVKELALRAKKIIEAQNRTFDVNIISASCNLPIEIVYENPQTLGVDRLCNAVACAKLFAGENVIIIDAGTAITIDILHEGKFFEGGIIVPGISMQLDALHSNTDSLPRVNITQNENFSFPAKSTVECIKTGVIYGAVGALEKILREAQTSNATFKIVATGGAWKIISPHITQYKIINIPDLTLIGASVNGNVNVARA